MENIHARLIVTVNTTVGGKCIMMISKKTKNGDYVVCNEIDGEEAVNIYKKLTDMEDIK